MIDVLDRFLSLFDDFSKSYDCKIVIVTLSPGAALWCTENLKISYVIIQSKNRNEEWEHNWSTYEHTGMRAEVHLRGKVFRNSGTDHAGTIQGRWQGHQVIKIQQL